MDKERYALVQRMKDTFTEVRELTVEETLKFRKEWRERFAGKEEKLPGLPLHNCLHCGGRRTGYDWHCFSFRHVPAVKDYVRRMRDASHPDENIMVWVERCGLPGIIVRLGELAGFLEKECQPTEELYVMPKKITWTLVFTHEEDFGPYFVSFP